MSDFDPVQQVRFRGKHLWDLTHAETREALIQALKQVWFLEGTRPPGVWPPFVPSEGLTSPMPLPPKQEFNRV